MSHPLEQDLERALEEFRKGRVSASTAAALSALKARFTAKKTGLLPELFRRLGSVPADDRPRVGALLNDVKQEIEGSLEELADAVALAERARALEAERVDVTLPGRRPARGSLHPTTRARHLIEAVFREMGYSVVSGPEIETDFHNFEALNMPPDHPARDSQDTFYFHDGLLLRTHTSPVQIRSMLASPPPLRLIVPGRTYRRDYDMTHLPMFHQIEGLVVGEGIRLSDLKGTLARFAARIFGEGIRVRLRPSYFPFVEPGAELDISCTVCGGSGCRSCKGSGWMEILGCGMVHPAVFEAVERTRAAAGRAPGAYDPERISGFAFGMGIDRIGMLRYGIDDIRLYLENDARFLEQFPA